MLFVHGFALNLGSFHFQRLALAETFGDQVRMVFYDLRSHGRSARSPQSGCSLAQLGRDLHTVIKAVIPSGPIVLVEATPKEYVEKGRFNQPERSKANAWPHPVIANGKLYILDQDVLLCYDICAKP